MGAFATVSVLLARSCETDTSITIGFVSSLVTASLTVVRRPILVRERRPAQLVYGESAARAAQSDAIARSLRQPGRRRDRPALGDAPQRRKTVRFGSVLIGHFIDNNGTIGSQQGSQQLPTGKTHS